MKQLLIVIDMQKDFVDGALGTCEAEKIVEKVVEKINHFDGDVIATMDTHFDGYMGTQEGKKLPIPHCIKDTEGWQLTARVKEALERKGYRALEKLAFGSTELPELIQKQYDTDSLKVELIGVCTDICVVSNALILKAHFPEMPIGVDSNCCAGVTPEKHQAALETMASCQIEIT